MNVFGYVRVSTENQLENYSIDQQTESIQAYCKARGWTLLKIYTDGGYSGGNTNRPALQQMLSDIKSMGHVDAVVVYKLDRLSRSQKDTLTLIEDGLLKNNTDFVSINENFDTSSPMGRAMIGILSVFAQLEKDQITERFTMGRIGRCKAGYFHGGGSIPYGYRYENGLLTVDPYQAEIVQQIFRSFLEGKTINAIWNDLRGKHSGKWSASRIANILRNSTYTGKVKFAGQEYDGVQEPIISRETYIAANELLNSSDRNRGEGTAKKTPFKAQTLLSGLIFCEKCGARYCGVHGYYKCYSRSKAYTSMVKDPNCKNDNWEISDLDSLVISEIKKLSQSPAIVLQIAQSQNQKEVQIDVPMVEKRLKEIENQTEKLIDLYQLGQIPMEMISKKLDALTMEKTALSAQLKRQSSEEKSETENFMLALKDFSEKFDAGTQETQRLLISCLVKRITIDGQHIGIEWRI